jgi:hypothetical protein
LNALSPKRWVFRLFRAALAAAITATFFAMISGPITVPVRPLGRLASGYLSAVWERQFGVSLPFGDPRLGATGVRGGSGGSAQKEFGGEGVYQNVLTLDVTKDTIKATRDFYLDKNDPDLIRLRDTLMQPERRWAPDTIDLFEKVFGYVLVNRRQLLFSPADLEINEESPRARLRSTSELINLSEVVEDGERDVSVEATWGDATPPDSEVIVNTEESRLVPGTMIPRHQDPKRALFVADASRPPGVRFSLILSKAERVEERRELIYSFLARFNNGYRIIEPLLLGLLYSTPFLLFLRLRRYSEFQTGRHYPLWFDVAGLFLFLYAGLSVTGFVRDLFLMPQLLSSSRIPGVSLFDGVGALVTSFSVLVWPTVTKEWERRRAQGEEAPLVDVTLDPKTKVVKILASLSILTWVAALSMAVAAALGVTAKIRCNDACMSILAVAFLVIVAVGLLASCSWLMYESVGRRKAFAMAVTAIILMVAYVTLDDLASYFWLRPVLAAILLVPVAFSFIRVTLPVTSQVLFATRWRAQSRTRRLLMTVGLAVLAFLLIWPPIGSL